MKKNLLFLLSLGLFHFSFSQTDTPPVNNYQAQFNQAYIAYPAIPQGMLEAVAFSNTRFAHITHNPGDPESCMELPGAYGVMGLTLDGQNYFRNNLVLVSQLSGFQIADIISDPGTNIIAYAKAYNYLLSQSTTPGSNPESQIPILIALSELPNNNLQNNFALNSQLYSILTFLNNEEYQLAYSFPAYAINLVNVFGAANYKILSAPFVTVSDESIIDLNGNQYQKSLSAPPPPTVQSADYGPAIWDPAASCNFSSRTQAITAVTIHDVEGSYAGCISWFKNCNAQVSAHYVLRSSDGQITQMVLESKKAWHVGTENGYTIGLEHEGYANQTGWYTVAMYTTSAALVKDICINSGYGIDPTTAYNGPSCACHNTLSSAVKIRGHQHYPNTGKTDPGINWNWTYYYCLINGCNSPPSPPPNPVVTSTNNCGTKTITRANPPSGTTYYWQGTSCGTSMADSSLNYTVSSSGTYYLRAKNSNGWSTCSSKTVTIIDCPENLFVSFGPCSNTMVNFSWINSNVNWSLEVSLDSAFGSYYSKPASNVTLLNGPAGFTPTLNFQPNATYYWRILTGNVYTYGPSFILPFCDVIAPATVITSIVGWQDSNFIASFIDSDDSLGSGLGKSFYRVIDFDGTEWRANGLRGFANDDFDNSTIHPDWTSYTGTWASPSGFLEQTDQALGNTNIAAPLTQNLSNRYLYHWNAKIDGSGTNRRAGFHFFCDSASLPNRGNSYFVWFRLDDNKIQFYKVTNDQQTLVKTRNYSFSAGQFYDFKLIYDRITGKMDIYINNIIAESWVDATPIASGNAVSFRTGDATMTINYFKTFRSRAATKTINVGAGNTNDIRYENSGPPLSGGKIESIVTDSAGNLSPVVSVPVDVDWTAPTAIAFINDGTGADIDTTYSSNELKANWSPSSDPNSGIAKYHYSIGTNPGDSNTLVSTDNFMQMVAINNPLPLVLNQLYYFNVRSQNGAGLFSPVASSNGQIVVLNTTSIAEEITVVGLNLYPNPFNNSTTLDYTLIKAEKVNVGLYDVLGQEIVFLKNESQGAGKHQITIDGAELKLSKGLYLVVLKTEKTSTFIKIVFD